MQLVLTGTVISISAICKAAKYHCVEGDRRHSISVRELPFDSPPIQLGLYICVCIQAYIVLTSNYSANRVIASHTWYTTLPTYSLSFPDR